MAPHKPVKSLLELSLNIASKSVYSACKNVMTAYPCEEDSRDALSAPGCREKIQEVQDFLRVLVNSMVWDSVYQAVMDLHEQGKKYQPDLCDRDGLMEEIFILATFIYDAVFLKRLRVNYFLSSKKSILQKRLGHFLLEQAPKLGNLVAADLFKVGCNFQDVILAFGRSCTNLEKLRMDWNCPLKTKNFVFQSCGRLRELENFFGVMTKESLALLKNLERVDSHVERWLQQFETSHRFKLQSLRLVQQSLKQLEIILEQCPHLKELHLTSDYKSSDQDLQILTASSATLKILTLNCCDIVFDTLHGFMSSKGMSLKELNLEACRLDRPLEILHMIGQTCPNLTTFGLVRVWQPVESPDSPEIVGNMSCPNLQHLVITLLCCNLSREALETFTSQSIASARNLKTFKLVTSYHMESMFLYDCWLKELFSSNLGVRNLEKIVLCSTRFGASKEISELAYKMCPKLTYLNIENPSKEARSYLKRLTTTLRKKHFDLDIKFSTERNYIRDF